MNLIRSDELLLSSFQHNSQFPLKLAFCSLGLAIMLKIVEYPVQFTSQGTTGQWERTINSALTANSALQCCFSYVLRGCDFI